MGAAPHRRDEQASIEALRDLDVLDTAPEAVFDALVRAASLVCGVPISLVSLIDVDRQWFKANVGLPGATETPRDVSFCAHAVLDDALFEIPDAQRDARFADNALVTGAPNIRFYAGVPLKLRGGQRIGSLCVIDRQPRQLTPQQRDILRALGEAAAHALEGRRAMEAITRSETALGLERQRLSAVIDAAHAGVWELDMRVGSATVSERWAQIMGETVAALQPLSYATFFDRVHPSDRARVLAALDAHIAGRSERFSAEFRVRHKDGHWAWVVDHGRVTTRATNGKPQWITGARIDITKRREQIELLRRSEGVAKRTGEMAGVGGWQFDLETRDIYWSDEICRIHGVAPGYKPKIEDGVNFYAPEVRAEFRAHVEECMAGGPGWDLELPAARRDGAQLWVRTMGSGEWEGGKLVRLVGAFQDVTARVNEHRALKTANERVALATDAGAIGIWELNLISRETSWDPWMYRIYGMTPTDGPVDVATWQKRLPPESMELLRQASADAVAGTRPFEVEFMIHRGDGQVRYLRSSGRVTDDAQGRRARLIGALWDVTDSRRLAAELRKQSALSAIQAKVGMVANQALTLNDTLQQCIDLVCTHGGPEIGHAYTRAAGDDDVLVSSNIWSNDSRGRFEPFRAQSAQTPFTAGVGLVGRALRDRRPVWSERMTPEYFLRHASAVQCGITWGLAAPVLVGNEVVAVLEFFGTTESPFDRSMVDLVSYTGLQVGRVVDRLRARDALERQTEVLREQSIVDELTGLYNRRGFLELAEARRRVAAQTSQRVFLLFADVDGMKRINDQLGHEAGDLVIREVAGVLKRVLRSADIVARLGGDEFVALVAETGTFERASLLGRLELDVANQNADKRLPFELAVSFGITGPTDPAQSLSDALKLADEAMYREKAARKRNR